MLTSCNVLATCQHTPAGSGVSVPSPSSCCLACQTCFNSMCMPPPTWKFTRFGQAMSTSRGERSRA